MKDNNQKHGSQQQIYENTKKKRNTFIFKKLNKLITKKPNDFYNQNTKKKSNATIIIKPQQKLKKREHGGKLFKNDFFLSRDRDRD